MNVFLLDYYTRLSAWYNFRQHLESLNADLKTTCIEVDKFWQQCPILNHYIHPADVVDWPTPWELLNDNTYCYYTRALGMIYTLLLLGNKDIELLDAIDDNNNEVVLVLVDNRKYVLNYWPGTVVNNNIIDFTIKKSLDISPLYNKIGLT